MQSARWISLRVFATSTTLLAAACGGAPIRRQPPPPLEIRPPRAEISTRFRADVRIDLAPLGGEDPDETVHIAITRAVLEAIPSLDRCFAALPPRPVDAWIVAATTANGKIERPEIVADAGASALPPEVAQCLTGAVSKMIAPSSSTLALSLSVHAEPAPADCAGAACTEIPAASEAAREGDDAGSREHGEEGTMAALNDDGAKYGMIGILGSGDGGVVPLVDGGIGIGSLGAFGHGGAGDGGGGRPQDPKAPSMRSGSMSITGRLPPEVVQRIVRRHFAELRACYENVLKTSPALEGSVNTAFTITEKGSVSKAEADRFSSIQDKGMLACMTKAFERFSFPEPEGGTVSVVYRLNFAPHIDDPPPAPILTVDGVGFPKLVGKELAGKLTRAGWRTAVVVGSTSDAPFVVFAIAKDASIDHAASPEGFVTSVRRRPAKGVGLFEAVSTSEGFQLYADGPNAREAIAAAVDDKGAAPRALGL